ncbi:MAG: PEP-CTERM sorting domain-containing protein [Phycisphaerales bacterium]|nr:PEP-CTERM sorting domain-containing protein [Phycisphaerales bacterium]
MRKSTVIAFAAAAGIAAAAGASTVQQTYYFTAADLINNQFANGADGTSAADNGLFNGARLLRDGSNPNSAQAARTYVASEHATFNSRWNSLVSGGGELTSFNLWGLDGRGINWGEDYKPHSWVSVSAPDGWSTGFHDAGPDDIGWFQNSDPSGSGYLDYNTSLFPYFTPDNGGLALDTDQSVLESLRFSVTIEFDPQNAFWGQDTQGAPNNIDSGLTMWWGGWVTDGVEDHILEGNMFAVIPLPGPAAMGLAGLGLVAAGRRRRA